MAAAAKKVPGSNVIVLAPPQKRRAPARRASPAAKQHHHPKRRHYARRAGALAKVVGTKAAPILGPAVAMIGGSAVQLAFAEKKAAQYAPAASLIGYGVLAKDHGAQNVGMGALVATAAGQFGLTTWIAKQIRSAMNKKGGTAQQGGGVTAKGAGFDVQDAQDAIEEASNTMDEATQLADLFNV